MTNNKKIETGTRGFYTGLSGTKSSVKEIEVQRDVFVDIKGRKGIWCEGV